jgi:hypothetical protein
LCFAICGSSFEAEVDIHYVRREEWSGKSV